MNFEIIKENDNSIEIASPCQKLHKLHKQIRHDHNTCFKIYAKQKEKDSNILIDVLKIYSNKIEKDGICCMFNVNKNKLYITYYNVPINFVTNKVNIPNLYSAFIQTSIHFQNKNEPLIHKIFIGQKNNKEKNNYKDVVEYNMLKNFYYIYLNLFKIQELQKKDIEKILKHDAIKEYFYSAGCICVFFDKKNLLNQKDTKCTNIIKFLSKIMQFKLEYYCKNTTNIKVIIDNNIKEYLYNCIKKHFCELKNIIECIEQITNIQEQYIYSKCNRENVNYSLIENLLSNINKSKNLLNYNNEKFALVIILLASFIDSVEFKMLHKLYQEAILYIMQKSYISEFIGNQKLITDSDNSLKNNIKECKQQQTKKAEVFMYITTGEIEQPDVKNYDIFDIFDFLKNSADTSIFN